MKLGIFEKKKIFFSVFKQICVHIQSICLNEGAKTMEI